MLYKTIRYINDGETLSQPILNRYAQDIQENLEELFRITELFSIEGEVEEIPNSIVLRNEFGTTKFSPPTDTENPIRLGDTSSEEASGAVVIRDDQGTAKFGIPTNSRHPLRKFDVVDNLSDSSFDLPLSANQGKILDERDNTLDEEKVNYSDVVNNLSSSETDKPLSANQGKILDDKVFNLDQEKVAFTDVVNNLTSSETDKPLSANQGRILDGKIQDINETLDTTGTLSDLQEVVDFIEANKDTLDNLTISNIAGLQSALDEKVEYADIVDNLSSTNSNVPLSANQGRALNVKNAQLRQDAVKYTDVVNNLTSTESDKPLSADRGRVLKDRINNRYTKNQSDDRYVRENGDTMSGNLTIRNLVPEITLEDTTGNTQSIRNQSSRLEVGVDGGNYKRIFHEGFPPTKEDVDLGNLPNSKTSSRDSDNWNQLLTARGMYDHKRSGDHDGRYSPKFPDVGDVGSYALMECDLRTTPGQLRNASHLWYSGAQYREESPRPSGTWRCMGRTAGSGYSRYRITVWVRVS